MGVGIDVQDLNAWFGKAQVLYDIQMKIEPGHVTAIIGPSGCGKSTYIRCLNRMHETLPDARVSGRVKVGDLDVYDSATAAVDVRRRIGMVFQKPLQLAALWDEVRDVLKKKSGASLSGGQQQRLCIARALAVAPEVLLMDEPASALDPISTGKIEELIFQLKERYTVVIVTHNMQQAARVADYTGFFLMGSLIEFDKTQKIFTTPSDQRTEDYITGRFG